MQEAFREYHALQCGFCTPGMVMSAIDLVQKHPEGLTEQQIREGLEGTCAAARATTTSSRRLPPPPK